MTKLIVAGLDPSLRNFGMFKLELTINAGKITSYRYLDCQLVKTSVSKTKQVRKNSEDLIRAKQLHDGLSEFIKDCHLVCVEIPVGSQTARAMCSYGICIGVLASVNIPMVQLTPSELKIAACKNKNATKKQMIEWATSKLPDANWLINRSNGSYTNDNEHLADAFASIVAGTKTDDFKLAITNLN